MIIKVKILVFCENFVSMETFSRQYGSVYKLNKSVYFLLVVFFG